LVVVAIIALLIAILLPSLSKAKEQARMAQCLSNVRSLGQGTMIYAAEYIDTLPGPLHPAVYRNAVDYLSQPNGEYWAERMLPYKLRHVFHSSGHQNETSDKLATCPTALFINPDENFAAYVNPAKPTHYVINNWGPATALDPNAPPPAPTDPVPRSTKPAYYFGLSVPDPSGVGNTSPQKLARIRRASDEWMIADGWYRSRTQTAPIPQPYPAPYNTAPAPRHEGPYQSGWTGKALPNFAYHGRRFKTYHYTNDAGWDGENALYRAARADGKTNTAYLDGHAESVSSRRVAINNIEVFYGFRGTVNGDFGPPDGSGDYVFVWPQF
jgi:prepilin-type processing-associated H-X9-DG protein